MVTPMDQEKFEKTGKLIGSLENAGSKVTGGVFSRILTSKQPQPQSWDDDAEWARLAEMPIKTRSIIYVVLAATIALLIWMALAHVDEVVSGAGKAMPSSGTQIVQAVDGGVVKELFVKERQKVKKGDLLLKIDTTRFNSSLGEKNARIMALRAKEARLEALSRGVPFTPPADVAAEAPDIVRQESLLYSTSLGEMNSNASVAGEQAAQRRQELVEANARLAQLSSACELADNELSATRKLLATGAASEIEVIRLQKEAARAKGDREQARAQVARARASIQEALGSGRDIRLRYINAWRSELSATMQELSSLTQGNKAIADQVSQAAVRSPITGTIKRLTINTLGAVVMPGGAIAEIVPDRDELIVEARLSPKDRAFVRPGQSVVVKFSAYEYAIYGGLDGKVIEIGPDTITDQNGATYYTVRIKTDKTNFGKDNPIVVGMVAQVDIVTGKKSILAYCLKPLFRAKENAFREH